MATSVCRRRAGVLWRAEIHQWIEIATTTKPKALLDEVFAVLDLLIVACVESYIYTQSPNSKTLGSSIKAESQLAAALWCTLQFLYI
jgi:hypothetical protein